PGRVVHALLRGSAINSSVALQLELTRRVVAPVANDAARVEHATRILPQLNTLLVRGLDLWARPLYVGGAATCRFEHAQTEAEPTPSEAQIHGTHSPTNAALSVPDSALGRGVP